MRGILLIKAQINAGYRLATKRKYIRNARIGPEGQQYVLAGIGHNQRISTGTCLTKKGDKVNLPIQIQNKIT